MIRSAYAAQLRRLALPTIAKASVNPPRIIYCHPPKNLNLSEPSSAENRFASTSASAVERPIVEPSQGTRSHAKGKQFGSHKKRSLRFAFLIGLFGAGSYILGVFFPPEALHLLYPPPVAPTPVEGSVEADAYVKKLEQQMLSLPHVRQLQASMSTASNGEGQRANYILSRPFQNYPDEVRQYNLTAGSLRKPGMLAVPYIVLSKTQNGAHSLGGFSGDAFAFVHLGRHLCGHQGIVHGGMLATVLDETLARTAFYHLPNHVGVTARLEIDYKRPVKANSVVVVETQTIEHHGRKAWVQATMRDLHGRTLVESKALFVEPKMAKWMDLSAIDSVMDRHGNV